MAAVSATAAREAWRTMHDLFLEGEAHDRLHQACATVGISPGLLRALVHLGGADGDGVRMGDLAEHWGCDASYVTSLADGLQARGLAERRAHPTDRRVKTLVLTAAGVSVRDQALALLSEPPPAFDALTAAEQRRLRDLLRKIALADRELARNRALTRGSA